MSRRTLSPITEELAEDFDECPESVQRLLARLEQAEAKAQSAAVLAQRLEMAEARIAQLTADNQYRSGEVTVLLRRNRDLLREVESKDRELAALVDINFEFKQLVQHGTKAVQTDLPEDSQKYKDMIVNLLEENQVLKQRVERQWECSSNESKNTAPSPSNLLVEQVRPKSGYVPSSARLLRKF